jgi:purine nucleosidase
LTNIALAVSKDPSIAALVRNIVVMGGSITGGNVNGAAEANIYNDPEAAEIVFNAGWMVTMVGSDVGERTLITRKYLAELQASHGPQSDFIAKIAECARVPGFRCRPFPAAVCQPNPREVKRL